MLAHASEKDCVDELIEVRDRKGMTALHVACARGDIFFVEKLLVLAASGAANSINALKP